MSKICKMAGAALMVCYSGASAKEPMGPPAEPVHIRGALIITTADTTDLHPGPGFTMTINADGSLHISGQISGTIEADVKAPALPRPIRVIDCGSTSNVHCP